MPEALGGQARRILRPASLLAARSPWLSCCDMCERDVVSKIHDKHSLIIMSKREMNFDVALQFLYCTSSLSIRLNGGVNKTPVIRSRARRST
jgi:hypothetical protein